MSTYPRELRSRAAAAEHESRSARCVSRRSGQSSIARRLTTGDCSADGHGRLGGLLFALLLRLAASPALLLGLAAGAVAALGELDERDRGGIAAPGAELGDARIPARTRGEARGDLVEQLGNDGAAAHEGQRLTASVQGVALAESD